MILECQECLFAGNAEVFEQFEINPSETIKHDLDEVHYHRCPRCGVRTDDETLGDGCPIAFLNEAEEISLTEAIAQGLVERGFEIPQGCDYNLADGGDYYVVLSDENYKEKYEGVKA